MNDIRFKEANTAEEIEQIHRLNHQVFAEEVGQHPQTADGRLIDRFHLRNRYFIATQGDLVVGMISVHDGPDFSVESRLKDVSVLRALRAPLEVRLLAIRPEYRNRSILLGLGWMMWRYAVEHRLFHFSQFSPVNPFEISERNSLTALAAGTEVRHVPPLKR